MGRLEKYQALAGRQLRENADLLYTSTGAWSDGTECRFSLTDPNETDQGVKLAQRLTGTPEVLDIRLLEVHPDDEPPAALSTLPWQGRTLTLISWGEANVYTRQSVGVCRLSP